ncbi:MAG: DegQ family serine endoprotease [Candidatus Aminicenantia bacterium]
MRKTVIISVLSFLLGAALYGLFFVYLPKSNLNEKDHFKTDPTSVVASSQSVSTDPTLNFVEVAKKVGPVVVKIDSIIVEKRKVSDWGEEWPFGDFWDRFFGFPREREREYESRGVGSGFIISQDGYILTNNHLVQNARQVKIYTVDEKEFNAKIVGTDPKTDLALLKIKGKHLPYTKLGDSNSVQIGEWVLAIGNPFGLSHTVTAGIVSAKGRQLIGKNVPEYQDFIQTDAAINRGNSGGPLVNMKGEVIGITSNILSPSGGNVGIGFAIPINLAKTVIKELKEKGRVIRGHLGVSITSITEDVKKSLDLETKQGALVNSVDPDTPADKAGLKRYDVIIEFDGEKIKDANHLKFKVAETPPDKKVKIKVIRDGKEKILTAVLDELESPEEEKLTIAKKDLGLSLVPLTPQMARRYGYRFSGGLLVTDVKRWSEADRQGIKPGDVILEVNRREVNILRDFERILERAKSGDTLMLLIKRGDFEFIRTLRIP